MKEFVSARRIRKEMERELLRFKPGTKEYDTIFADYCEIRNIEINDKKASFSVSGDVVVATFANLACIYMIVNAEQTTAVVSKALAFVPKIKIL